MHWNACVAVSSLQAPSASNIVDKVSDTAASRSHVSETGDASLSHTLRHRCCTAQRLLAICCPTAQNGAGMSETKLVKLDEVNSACDLW